MSSRGNELLFFSLSYLRHLSFESCPLIQGDCLVKGVRCSLGSLFWLINILSEECRLFFIQVSFSFSSASLSCSVSNVSRLVLHNIAVLGSTTIPLPQLSQHFIWQRRLSVLSSFPLSILIWEALSFVLILTFHVIFINVSNILLTCFLNYFSLSWPLEASGSTDLGCHMLMDILVRPASSQVQLLENNYQSKFTFIIWVTVSSWHVTFPWNKAFHPFKFHMFYGIGKEGNVYEASGFWGRSSYCSLSVERADLNLRLLYSPRDRERINKLPVVVLGLNGQNSVLTAPTKSWMRIKRQEGRTKGPSLPLELSSYCPANFHLQILTGLARACSKNLNRCPSLP